MPISVLFCIDGNFWQHLGVTVASLLYSNPANTFRLHVVSASDMPSDRLADLERIVIEAGNATLEAITFKEADRYQYLPVHSHLTFAMYLRLFMTEYLDPSLDKVLYFDSDIILCSDIAELWAIDLGDNYLGAAREPYDFKQRSPLNFGPDDLYINSGVMLVNLAKWRREEVVGKFIAFADAHHQSFSSPDQDILNSVFRGRILDIGYEWNWQALFVRSTPAELNLSPAAYASLRRSPRLVHFTSRYKPWFYRWQPHYKHLYYQALARTPWAAYTPPDQSLRNLPTRIKKSVQRQLEWHAPALARRLRTRSKP